MVVCAIAGIDSAASAAAVNKIRFMTERSLLHGFVSRDGKPQPATSRSSGCANR
jgi:hypothetical protein